MHKGLLFISSYNLNRAVFYSICTNLLRIKDLRKASTYPLVCLRFSQTLLHQDLGTFLRKKPLNLGIILILTVFPTGRCEAMSMNNSSGIIRLPAPYYDGNTSVEMALLKRRSGLVLTSATNFTIPV